MNKWFLALAFLCILVTEPSFQAKALTFDHLPTKQTSKHWSVQIGKAIESQGSVKPEKGKFHTYSLNVNNTGEDVISVKVNLYRNEPGSKTKYSLTGCPDEKDCTQNSYEQALVLAKQLNEKMPYVFQNFLLAEKATELEVEIVWTQKENPGRPLKETFVFTQK
ncbi:hypothetical protein M3610_13540 [Neobacillus sp. MER 74]|uniref:hypothetical protein n=1 Tax=Neobacillus sp. MER 74 TaxID=2939566 RepID=UPI00204159C6|nr:hypothetical protein [Neobacillus sp. MER 74]MCM3116322.1 hypothetical protein [Neobacillus sp. MER 74]